MIKIEKNNDNSTDYLLHLGNKQSHALTKQDLKNLHHCLTQTIEKGPEDAPEFPVRILSDNQFSQPGYHDGRSTLWIGTQKWHLNPKEETGILNILESLLKNNETSQ